ncbi:MAG: nicotinic acid mononucleotide adenylyltransferase, partial [Prochlorotrichaceae cyanobacterium]
VQLLIVPRPGFPLHDRDLQALKALGTTVQVAQWQGLAVSSTAFREAGDPEPLTDLVYHFIRQHHLYPLLLELGSGS